MPITHASASAAILHAVETDTLIQSSWHRIAEDGRALACLLGAIDPSVNSAEDCNADLMPLWLAETTVQLFDRLPPDQIKPLSRRYGSLIARWHVVLPEGWEAIQRAFMVGCIDDALASARPVDGGEPYWPAVESACAECRRLLVEQDTDVDAALAAARAAADAAQAADAVDAEAAGTAADTAAYAVCNPRSAADAADAVDAEAAGRLFVFLLDQVDAAILHAERGAP